MKKYAWRKIKCKYCKKSYPFGEWLQVWLRVGKEFYREVDTKKPLQGIECSKCGKEQIAPNQFYKKIESNILRSRLC